jgi:hypothetical protein
MTAIMSHGRPGKTQAVPFTATSAAAAALGQQTFRVRLAATSGCLVTLANTDEAGMYIAPNFPEVFIVTPGQILNVMQQSAAGTLFITELE